MRRLISILKNKYDEWSAKRKARQDIEVLVDGLAHANELLSQRRNDLERFKKGPDVETSLPVAPGESRAAAFIENARLHIERADGLYKHALLMFREQEFENCLEFAERATVDLYLACMNLEEESETPFLSTFAEDSCERVCAHLSESLARTKLGIECASCKVSDDARHDLAQVMHLFQESLEQLEKRHEIKARRMAESGIYLLRLVTQEIEIENQQPVADIRPLPGRSLSRHSRKIEELVEAICQCKRVFLHAGLVVPEGATRHLQEARNHYHAALENLMDDDVEAAEAAAEAGMLEVRLSERLYGSSNPVQESIAYSGETLEIARDFKLTMLRLRRQAARLPKDRGKGLEAHLAKSEQYYDRACTAYSTGKYQEAERLAKAAYLDLDFARQLIFSKQPAVYRDV